MVDYIVNGKRKFPSVAEQEIAKVTKPERSEDEVAIRMEYGLTTMQAAFVIEYVIDRNPMMAAIRAGYAPKSARTMGYRLLRENEGVARGVSDLTAKWMEKSRITREWVLAKIANNINEAERAGKYAEVNRGLDMLMRHLQMYDEPAEEEETTTQFIRLPDGQEVEF